jgi:peptidoglycan/LPS O-acetylase OafA/YrhL
MEDSNFQAKTIFRLQGARRLYESCASFAAPVDADEEKKPVFDFIGLLVWGEDSRAALWRHACGDALPIWADPSKPLGVGNGTCVLLKFCNLGYFDGALRSCLPEAGMKIHFLQALRAIAAWLVVADHALLDVTHGDLGNPATPVAWTMGSIGVYVFFVISGFIMVQICWDDFGRRGAAANFLRRRIIRIVPLYWLATVAAFAFHKVSVTHGANAGWSELLRSMLFIPYRVEDGTWTPVLSQGWTLNYEMFFYTIFTAAIAFPRQIAIPAIGTALVVFVSVGSLLPAGVLAYLSSPIVLWFVLGIGLAVLWRLYGFVEPQWLAKSAKFFEVFGDASYSIYLVHGLALTMLLRSWVTLAGGPTSWFIAAGLVAATVAGLGVHVLMERPILRIATNLSKTLQTPGLTRKAEVRTK